MRSLLSRIARKTAQSMGSRRNQQTIRQASAQVHQQPLQDWSQRPPCFQDFLPVDQFSNSIYSVPMLLLFRLFYHASPLEQRAYEDTKRSIKSMISSPTPNRAQEAGELFQEPHTLRPDEFLACIQNGPSIGEQYNVRSVTWVKALASPLSHEYIQVIIEKKSTKERHRIAVDRSDAGDAIIAGWDWSSGEYPSHHFILPLPLLTLSFEQSNSPPSLLEMATIITSLSSRRRYNLLREMCWWFSEKLFISTSQQFSQGVLHAWPCAHLRYSFIVHSQWTPRHKLAQQAENFKSLNMRDLRY